MLQAVLGSCWVKWVFNHKISGYKIPHSSLNLIIIVKSYNMSLWQVATLKASTNFLNLIWSPILQESHISNFSPWIQRKWEIKHRENWGYVPYSPPTTSGGHYCSDDSQNIQYIICKSLFVQFNISIEITIAWIWTKLFSLRSDYGKHKMLP